MAGFLVIQHRAHQMEYKQRGKDKNGQATIITNTVAGMRRNEKAANSHDGTEKTKEPIGYVFH